ncbi:MAG: four-carbon acid sugar kinase family protein [Bacillota bacterium]
MPYLGIIADDLTGANDTIAVCAEQGLASVVLLHPAGLNCTKIDAFQAIAVSTDSRNLGQKEGVNRVRQACRFFQEAGISRIYKKIDSTWRGWIGPEVETIMEELGFDLAVICSSFPINKRTIVGGYLLVDGQPVARTALAKDPAFPVTESYLPGYLAAQTRFRVVSLPLTTLADGKRLEEEIRGYLAGEKTIAVADGVSEQDLAQVASLELKFPGRILFCGSAGLAGPWLKNQEIAKPLGVSPALVVIGSTNPANGRQVECLAESAGAEVVWMEPSRLLAPDPFWQKEAGEIADKVVACLQARRDCVLRTSRSSADVIRDPEAAREIGLRLGKTVKGIVSRTKVAGMVLTGGDTAVAVLQSLGAHGVEVQSEVLPGIPAGKILGGVWAGLPVVTKAGGFGEAAAISVAVRHIKSAAKINLSKVYNERGH